jgi:hypothetical protein
VDHVQVKHNKDDCFEFFGGTVDVRYAIATSCGDDSFDWVLGWTGRVQYLVIHQQGDDADNGFEADNNATNHDLLPRSMPQIYNATLIGDPDFNDGPESDDGVEIRVGSAMQLKNFILMGFKENGIDVSDDSTVAQMDNGSLSITHGILFQNGTTFDSTSRSRLSAVATLRVANPELIDPYNHANPNYRPSSIATLAGGQMAPAMPPNDGFFDVTTFIGALSPDPALDWTQGWTNFDRLRGTAESPEALAIQVIEAYRAGNRQALDALALTREEFRAHVWPELPISRPEVNLPFDVAWGQLAQKSALYQGQLSRGLEGHDWTLVRVAFAGEATEYDGVTVHRDTELLVRNGAGEERTIRLFGSTIEQDGRYKVFSFVVDD